MPRKPKRPREVLAPVPTDVLDHFAAEGRHRRTSLTGRLPLSPPFLGASVCGDCAVASVLSVSSVSVPSVPSRT